MEQTVPTVVADLLLDMAKYLCRTCGFEWFEKYKKLDGPTRCHQCNHSDIKWLNYKKFLLKHTKGG